jgi:ABC-2 type transport system permease protein/lipopolysaccharide transport system permease protein
MPHEDGTARWVENRAGAPFRIDWPELWRSRELIGFFALRDVRIRYKQASLGIAWVVLVPLVTVGAFTVAFDRLADVPSDGLPYPVFALSGLVAWTYVSQCVSQGSEVLVRSPELINKTYFPRLLAPLASLLPPLVDLAVGLVVLGVVCLAYGIGLTPAILLLPLWLCLLVLTALGPVLLLSAVNVRFRDVRHLVAPALQALLFLSPVAYTASSLSGLPRLLYSLNPAVGVLETGRWILVGAERPGPTVLASLAVAAALAVGGLLVFQRASTTFADVI